MGKMTSINSGISREDDDTWELLKENKVIVPESIKKILNDLNFSGIRALAKVNESSVMIEEYIRDVLGDPDVLEIMNKEEKLQIFGSIFSRCPSKFKLSPGHKVTFQILSEVCKEIVQRWTIICKVKPRQSMGVPSGKIRLYSNLKKSEKI
jgi:sulfur carrier protein ThiS